MAQTHCTAAFRCHLLTPVAEMQQNSTVPLPLTQIKWQLVLPSAELVCQELGWGHQEGWDTTGWCWMGWKSGPGVPRVGQWSGALNTGLFSALLLLSFLSWAESRCQPCLIHHLCLSLCIEQALGTIFFLFLFFFFLLCAALVSKKPRSSKRILGEGLCCKYKNIPCKRQASHRNAIWQPAQTCHCTCQTSWAASVIWGESFLSQRNLQAFPRSPDASLTGRQGSAHLGHSLQSSDTAQSFSSEILLLLQGLLWQLFVLSTQQLTTRIGTSWSVFQDIDWQLQWQIFEFLT